MNAHLWCNTVLQEGDPVVKYQIESESSSVTDKAVDADAQLILRIVDGDQQALADLFLLYRLPLFHYLLQFTTVQSYSSPWPYIACLVRSIATIPPRSRRDRACPCPAAPCGPLVPTRDIDV